MGSVRLGRSSRAWMVGLNEQGRAGRVGWRRKLSARPDVSVPVSTLH